MFSPVRLHPQKLSLGEKYAKARSMKNKPGRNDRCPCGSGKKYKACHLLKVGKQQFNRKFNRWERANAHDYHSDFGTATRGEHLHEGMIKCKLLHRHSGSIIVPDFIFISGGAEWIQPLAFYPCVLVKDDNDIEARLFIDISGGQQLEVHFRSSGFKARLEDGSELFACSIMGPEDLAEHATGSAEFRAHRPFLKLFHHTSENAKNGIVAGKSFWASSWNIQGTKKLSNVGYVYLTPLDRIKFKQDLERIGMASNGRLLFAKDGVQLPKQVLNPAWARRHRDDFIALEVYRANTLDRTHGIEVVVDAATLAPAHLYMHRDNNGFMYYEISTPWINRIGLAPGEAQEISDDMVISLSPKQRRFEYIVVGDAGTLEGLAAPYDEEDTGYIFKIEYIKSVPNQLEFWFTHPNTDHFSGKNVELQRFSR